MPVSPATPGALQNEIVTALDLEAFDPSSYDDRSYLEAALAAGFDVADLATAHEVTERSIYRALERNDIDPPQPPRNGPARRLLTSDRSGYGE